MANAIRERISKELGVEPILINSALVSAQNRQRFYWTNIPGVQQPEDRGILLRDVLDDAIAWQDKSYCVTATEYKGSSLSHNLERRNRTLVAKRAGPHAVPVRAGEMPTEKGEIIGAQSKRIYAVDGKSRTLLAHAGGGNGDTSAPSTGLYAVPASIACRGRNGGHAYEVRGDGKSNAVIVGHESRMVIEDAGGKTHPVYEVRDRKITIRGREYPIKLPDGFYIIRKLTVAECKRLQTVPEDYIFPVSASQALKMLGNGWTVDVAAHILSFCPELGSEDVEVLSMYDGMSCGQIALRKLGAHISKYYATEIDKYAVQTTQANYPKTIQLGDAFQVRDTEWALPQCA